MRFRQVACLLATAGLLALGPVSQALALHPELKIPEKVDVRHRACQEILRLAQKYQVDGVFDKDFEQGKTGCSRMDVAVALELVMEKMADKVVKEGSAAVANEDLVLVSDLKEELRGEMLLVNTRTFQQRREELGTRLTAVTKNITVSGGLTGVVQGSFGHDPDDHVDAVGRGDIVFSFKVGENTIAAIDLEATGGDGIDAEVQSFSGLNAVGGSTGDRARFREAWVEHSMLGDRLLLTVGKIDLGNYFDTNQVANDENAQFLASAFTNSATLGAPGPGPGARLQAKLTEQLNFGLGYGSGSTEARDIEDHPYAIGELDYRLKYRGKEGNYRIYGFLDSSLPVVGTDPSGNPVFEGTKIKRKDAWGYGLSIDQQIGDQCTLFGRWGARDREAFQTELAWSLGFQYEGAIPSRAKDMLGFAYGQVQVVDAPSDEKLAELYYKFKANDQISITPVLQYLIDPQGNRDAKNVVVSGVRTQISF